MLKSILVTPLSEFDEIVFQMVVPQDHYLRKVMACIDFETFRPRLNLAYSLFWGRPPNALSRSYPNVASTSFMSNELTNVRGLDQEGRGSRS